MKTKNVEEYFAWVERLSLSMILKKFLKFLESEPRDLYKLDFYEKSL